jgi:hypothetical protein
MGSTLVCRMQSRDAVLGSGGRRENAESQRHGTIAIIGGFRDGRIQRRGRMT